ncbi:GvpL/GvpF family gas vesicle protein [Streptosporangium sp. NPDC004379]|uniref:GvpL/GvpF family gas vesicle protein n=1 Tax=Streptosporangium sp. NPDC004379 TaxID=3366189 RepID=UPI003693CA6E
MPGSTGKTATTGSEQAARKPARRTTGKAAGEADGKTTAKPARKTTGRTAGEADGKTAAKPARKTTGRTAGEADGKTAAKPARKTTGKGAGRTAGKTTGKAAPSRSGGAARRGRTGYAYVYGVVPADVETEPGTLGVDDGEVTLVRHGEIAALVSDIVLDRPLGRPDDLLAHEQLLDATAAEVPVLPFRFGAVMTGPKEVVEELLAPHHDEFLAALEELEGRAEYVIKGRYVEPVIIREVLDENPEAERLRQEVRGQPEEATWDARIRLGQMIGEAVAAKRDADTQELVDAVAPLCVAVSVREPTHEQDAAYVAVLVDEERQEEFDEALDDLGDRWAGRIGLRLLGPLAPYDFVAAPQPEE